MTDPTVAPPFALRQYVYAVLKKNDYDVWKESNYGGKMPVVPLGEDADLEQYSGPTIVYEWSERRPDNTLWARRTGTVTYGVRDTNLRRLTRTMTILKEALGRFDESAKDVNGYMSSRGAPWNTIGFGYISVNYVDQGRAPVSEGGEMVGIITIAFDYFVDYEVNTTPHLP